jgi:peroxiredoxin Q/BCP
MFLVGVGVTVTGIVSEERSGSLHVGDAGPDFSARASNGEVIRLSQYRGKKNVVLFFYPKDFTPGCTKEVCGYRDNYDQILGHDAVIFGVSVDDAESHDRFVQTYRLPFPLISDTDRAISKAYGVLRLGGLLPLAKRITYVIDKKGVIRNVIHHELEIGKHLDEAAATLHQLEPGSPEGPEKEPEGG